MMDAPPVQYVTTSDGYNIAYAGFGSGPPLLLVWGMQHLGLQWTSPLYRRFYRHLAETNLVVQYDPRGQGMSTRGIPESVTLDDFARDIETIVDHLNLERFALLGIMRLGNAALRFASRHPDRVRALILWNCDPGSPSSGAWGTGTRLAPTNWDYLVESTARTSFPQDDFEVQRNIKAHTMSREDFLVTLPALGNAFYESELRGIRVPTLVLATRSGAWSFATEEGSTRLAATIPGANLSLFDDVGGGLFSTEDEVPPGIRAIRHFTAAVTAPDRRAFHAAAPGRLSRREAQILRLVARGMLNQEIADELVISINTVRRHVSNILDKTGVANRAQAVAYARDHGIE
jgi:DNA-binding CsgD family transcriptional regulator